ncbi:excinuclease ABC subunit UvrB [Candidatus Nanohalococcus occultus]|uniref:UvrABC system protein B n=1 Tax=Candidatus Nanohalococcus occultus TaxID=2978047 RepID=A0ABY8CIT2_9ARCH|nr:Excinuclease ABC subunit B, helicase [Candidatus Nanohaloarchaeota archaeon SVXNc]
MTDEKTDKEKFRVEAPFTPAGDQPEAIEKLSNGFKQGMDKQTLLGVTGSGKTNTVSWTIEEIQKPTLVIAHNKTLAAQLYDELKQLFPDNAVEYFVSYYDYYQPEAYVKSSDTYIGKDASINEEIEKLRHSATNSLLTRDDVIVVASVSAIYGLGDPDFYKSLAVEISEDTEKGRDQIIDELVDIQYERSDEDFKQGKFRLRGDTLDVFPMYSRTAFRISFWGDEIEKITEFKPLENETVEKREKILVRPASHYSAPDEKLEKALEEIEELMEERIEYFESRGDAVAAQRIEERTKFDLEMIREAGYCSGIENYSVHLSDREHGDPPYTLLDYFPDDFLTVIDESHQTIPQIKGQYAGDEARKESLVENGFRLPTAFDNRPLKFDEFKEKTDKTLFVSATPGDYETEVSEQIVEQIVRPTYLLDPTIEVRETERQVEDVISEIEKRAERDERTLVTTLSKNMAENLSEFLQDAGINAKYMHHETDTLERHEIIRKLRVGEIDVVVGINLLREGLDIPEVSLVAILEADQAGFLRSETALVQTMGRAARNQDGHVIMYGDEKTDAMKNAISETDRRRKIQRKFNEENGKTPRTIEKEVTESTLPGKDSDEELTETEFEDTEEARRQVVELEEQMKQAAENLEFELAAEYRDKISEIKEENSLE